jgi:Fe-S cluster assembly ATPase SufC
MREESVPFDNETCKLCIQASLATQNPTLVEPMLDEMISGVISTNLRDVSDLTESEMDQLLALMVAVRSRKLASYVAQERRHHVNGSSLSEGFLKLEDLASRIPAENTSIPESSSS